MSVGGGGGKGSSDTSSPAANTLAKLAESFAGETKGIRTGLIDAMQQVLSTGGSKIPIISRAVESSREASSKALTQTEEQLAQQGLSGTPYGADVLAKQVQSGEQAVASTRESLAQNVFNMISNFVLGQSQTALGGLAGAIPGMKSTDESAKGLSLGIS